MSDEKNTGSEKTGAEKNTGKKLHETSLTGFFSNGKKYRDSVEDIKEKPYVPRKKNKKLRRRIKRVLTVIVTFLISVFLIFVITGTIVSTALSIYVMNFMDEVADVTIEELELTYNTYVYANNKKGELVKLYEVANGGNNTIPVESEDVPQHVRDAFVYTEDERFYNHDGVDYKRTFSAFINMFMHIYNTNQGGSTITQQLVKNITGDNEQSPARKIREIFRAMQLEKSYSKEEILTSYMNYIGFGGPTVGIEAASRKYFGKHVNELDVAEAASLASIPKSPETLNPFVDRDANKERQKYVLAKMYRNGAISYDEYQTALHEHLIFTDSDEYVDHESIDNKEIDQYDSSQATTWVVDTAINEFADYLGGIYNISRSEAIQRINRGGYQIYTTVDLDMQEYVEEKYLDIENLMDIGAAEKTLEDGTVVTPQSAFVAMNYEGEIQAIVGAVGKKTDSLCWNYATMEDRQPGSAIKPLTTYGCGIETGTFSWGTLVEDEPILVNGELWPTNYSTDSNNMTYSGMKVSLYYGLQNSLNTVSARICNTLTPARVFAFATQKMGLDLLTRSEDGKSTDNALSPLSVGALSYGVTLKNLVNGYVPYGNGGMRYDAHIVSKVEHGNKEVVYENDGSPQQAVDPQTAFVMNKLLQNVVTSGTGRNAQLYNKTVAGKTGTSQDWNDLLFVGLTEDFVSGVWLGYVDGGRLPLSTYISSAQVWSNIIGEYADSLETGADYPENEDVIRAYVCTNTGKIATESCPKGEMGYWRSDAAPVCDECGGTQVVYANDDGTPVDSSLYYHASKQYYSYTPQEEEAEEPAEEGGNDYSGGDSGDSGDGGGDQTYDNSGGDAGYDDGEAGDAEVSW